MMSINEYHDVINEERSHGCLMYQINVSNWKDILKLIDKNDLYEEKDESYGLEHKPHVTVLYGLHSNEIKDSEMKKFVKSNFKSINIDLPNKFSLFKNENFDVLKFDIKNKDLSHFNSLIESNFPFTSKFPIYKAHTTVAYLKPGTGKKYLNIKPNPNHSSMSNTVIYSKSNNTKMTIHV